MKILILLFLVSSYSYADVSWDIPVEKFSAATGKIYLSNLLVGDTAKINEYSLFCTTDDGKLAVSGMTETGEGEFLVKLKPGKKIELTVQDPAEFVKMLINDESYALCSWWTADKGKSAIVVESVNGKKSLSGLLKNNKKMRLLGSGL